MNNRRVFHVPGTNQTYDEFGRIVDPQEVIRDNAPDYHEHDVFQDRDLRANYLPKILIGCAVILLICLLVQLIIWTVHAVILILSVLWFLTKVTSLVIMAAILVRFIMLGGNFSRLVPELKLVFHTLPASFIRWFRL